MSEQRDIRREDYREEHERRIRRRKRVNIWLAVGVGILIILLFLWLTFADLMGDTDVAAEINSNLLNAL